MRRCLLISAYVPVFAVCIILLDTELLAQAQSSADATYERATAADNRRDFASEFKLCTALTAQGDVRGQVCLGVLYLFGQGVLKNDKESRRWYRMAAEQGEATSQFDVGGSVLDGVDGVPPNPIEGAKWYRRSADQGYAEAEFALGILYFDGNGVPQDNVQAYMWANLAIANAQRSLAAYPPKIQPLVSMATNMRSQAARRMSQDQIAEAQRRARDWKPKATKATCIVYPAMCDK